ncbi:hypothetical protein HDU91_002480, partial [Kappamyces sp. JEL0680]
MAATFLRNALQQKPIPLLFQDLDVHDFASVSQQLQFLESLGPKLRHPLDGNRSYAIKLIKRLLQELENARDVEVCDDFYEMVSHLLSMPPAGDGLVEKTYILPWTGGESAKVQALDIVEDVASISNGTTGLSTWGASLFLLEYIAQHLDLVKEKKVLELGAGAGLL